MNLADLFTPSALTTAVNTLPTAPSMLGDSGLFTVKPIKELNATIESINGRLVLVEDTDRNGDPDHKGNKKRSAEVFRVPHLPKTATILPDELNVRAFGDESANGLAAPAQVINDKLQGLKDDIETTKEFHRVGAICGKILDADGVTVIHDLYKKFGVTEKSINVAFSNPATDIRAKLLEAKRYAKKQLGGALIKKWVCYCSSTYFDGLTGHDSVQKAFANYQEAADRLAGDKRTGFTFADIEFIEYDVEVINKDGDPVKFIADGTARLVPVVDKLFLTIYSPANYNGAVNTLGQPMYAMAEEREMTKGWKLEAQSNPLSICTAPGALVKLVAA